MSESNVVSPTELPPIPDELMHPENYKDPAIHLLGNIEQKLEITLPTADEVLSKIQILHRDDYKNACHQKTGSPYFLNPHDRSMGLTISREVAYLNIDRIAEIARVEGKSIKDMATTTVTHEIIHLTEAKTFKRNNEDLSGFIDTRYGLLISYGDPDDLLEIGSTQLEEGVVEFIRSKELEPYLPPALIRYPDEVEIVQILTKEIGELPFYHGLYSSVGISLLNSAIDDVYGKNMFRRLLANMAIDFKRRNEIRNDQVRTDYKSTKALLGNSPYNEVV